MTAADQDHWQRRYRDRPLASLSWTEESPILSLALIAEAKPAPDAPIVDVGGGASTLAADLVDAGHTDVTVIDISAEALAAARRPIGEDAKVGWLVADVRTVDLVRRFDLWHDRAVFHFMVEQADIDAYLRTLGAALVPGGDLVIATFSPDGPSECSGLPVRRYDAAELGATLGAEYDLVSSRHHTHQTPAGNSQAFIYAHFRRHAGPDSLR